MKPPEPYPKIHTGYVDKSVLWCADTRYLQPRYMVSLQGVDELVKPLPIAQLQPPTPTE